MQPAIDSESHFPFSIISKPNRFKNKVVARINESFHLNSLLTKIKKMRIYLIPIWEIVVCLSLLDAIKSVLCAPRCERYCSMFQLPIPIPVRGTNKKIQLIKCSWSRRRWQLRSNKLWYEKRDAFDKYFRFVYWAAKSLRVFNKTEDRTLKCLVLNYKFFMVALSFLSPLQRCDKIETLHSTWT